MDLPVTSVLTLRANGHSLTATIDDPATRNAMTDALLGDFLALLEHLDLPTGFRSLVIRGSGGLFCAGADLKGNLQAETELDGIDPATALSCRGAELFHRLNACPLPVIVVVDGPAFGGGFGLACCADFVLCGPRARFALSETRLGLIPAQIAPFVLARLGLPAARRLALTGTRLKPEEAVAIGLADAAFGDGESLDQAVEHILDDIAQCAPRANAMTKRLFLSLAAEELDSRPFIEQAAGLFVQSLRSAEGQEGLAAFAAKRRPNWTT